MRFQPRSAEAPEPLPGFEDWFGALLRIRGIDTPEAADRFLNHFLRGVLSVGPDGMHVQVKHQVIFSCFTLRSIT